MTHSTNPDEFLEVSGYKLGTVIRNDSGGYTRIFLQPPLHYDFYICFSHGFTDFPMNDIAAVTIQNTAKIIKGPADIEVRYVCMPVGMGFKWMDKTITLTAVLLQPIIVRILAQIPGIKIARFVLFSLAVIMCSVKH